MTMPAEHQEAEAQLAKERQTQEEVVAATVDNSRSITEVNRALVKFHEGRGVLYRNIGKAVPWAVVGGVAWTVWAMVHWG